MDNCPEVCRRPSSHPPVSFGLFQMLFETTDFSARWQCGRWPLALGWLQIVSDLAIFAAYLSIAIAAIYFLQQLLRAIANRARAEARMLALVASRTDNAVIVTDPLGRIQWVNQGFTRITGYDLKEVLGRTPGSVLQGPRTDPAVVEHMHQQLRLGQGFRSEVINYAKDGREYWLAIEVQPILDHDGRLVQFMAIEADITERAANEEAIGRARDELEARVHERTERRQAEEQVINLNRHLQRRLDRIASLRRIDIAITASLDLRVTLDTVLDQVTLQLGVAAAAVLLLEPHAHTLAYAASRGFRGPGISRSRVRLDDGSAGAAASERRLIHIPDLRSAGEAFTRSHLLMDESLIDYYAVPLLAKGQVKGVLEVYHREALEPDPEWFDFLETLAGQAAIAVDGASLFDQVQRANLELTFAYDATIEGWSRALDLRDKETEGHTLRVTEMTIRLARALGVGEAELVHVRRGALLHDIGKLGIPDDILLKAGPLTNEEWQVMRRHPRYAHDWLSPIPYLAQPWTFHTLTTRSGTARAIPAGSRVRRSRWRRGSSPSWTSGTPCGPTGPTERRGPIGACSITSAPSPVRTSTRPRSRHFSGSSRAE